QSLRSSGRTPASRRRRRVDRSTSIGLPRSLHVGSAMRDRLRMPKARTLPLVSLVLVASALCAPRASAEPLPARPGPVVAPTPAELPPPDPPRPTMGLVKPGIVPDPDPPRPQTGPRMGLVGPGIAASIIGARLPA